MKFTYLLRYPGRAFSLIELLVSLAVILVLAALLFPLIETMRASAAQATCASRLRQVGLLLHSYVADRGDDTLKLFRDGSHSDARKWYSILKESAGLSDAEAQKQFGCPLLPIEDVADWHCYGVRAGGAPGYMSPAGVYQLPVYSVENPARFLLAADSLTPSSGKPDLPHHTARPVRRQWHPPASP